ncbi:MAG TPA: hypothetical protein VKU62_07930 [Thermoanaerobaculia bacterium]|nr:hypothetical protein [Thermoanaerobaculia bacterium]
MTLLLPERRRRTRFLTLKNAGIAVVAVIVAFSLLSVWSAWRPHSAASDNAFSRGAEVFESSPPVRADPMIVREGRIDNDSTTDSLLLDAGALNKLRAHASQTLPAAAGQTDFEHQTPKLGKGQRITISGGSEGVEIHTEPMPIKAPRR